MAYVYVGEGSQSPTAAPAPGMKWVSIPGVGRSLPTWKQVPLQPGDAGLPVVYEGMRALPVQAAGADSSGIPTWAIAAGAIAAAWFLFYRKGPRSNPAVMVKAKRVKGTPHEELLRAQRMYAKHFDRMEDGGTDEGPDADYDKLARLERLLKKAAKAYQQSMVK